jgi:hypothetical protein
VSGKRLHYLQSVFSKGSDDQRKAIFQTLRQDGFRADPAGTEVQHLTYAADAAKGLPPDLAKGYLDTLPGFGLSRMIMVVESPGGLFSQLDSFVDDNQNARAAKLIADVQGNLDSTSNLRVLLGRSHGVIQLFELGSKTLDAKKSADVVDNFAMRQVTLSARAKDGSAVKIVAHGDAKDNGVVALDQYFSNPKYKEAVLKRLGVDPSVFERMLFSVSESIKAPSSDANGRVTAITTRVAEIDTALADKTLSEPARAALVKEKEELLDEARMLGPIMHGSGRIEIDVSPRSQVYQQFALDGKAPPDPLLRMTSSLFDSRLGDYKIHMETGAKELEVSVNDMKAIMAAADPKAEFEKRYKDSGVSFDDAKAAFQQYNENNKDFTIKVKGYGQKTAVEINVKDMAKLIQDPAAFKKRFPGVDYRDAVLTFAFLVNRGTGSPTPPPPVIDLTKTALQADGKTKDDALDALRLKLADGVDGNATAAPFLSTVFGADVSIAKDNVGVMTGAAVSAISPVARFQYGHITQWVGAEQISDTRAAAKKAFDKNGAKPSNVFGPLFGWDKREKEVQSDVMDHESGETFGWQRDFAKLTGDQVHVVSMSADDDRAGMRAAFNADADSIADTFGKYGGVPKKNLAVYKNPTGAQAYAALENQILATPPGEAVVFCYNGHGHPTGMAFREPWLKSEEIQALMTLAKSRGVNFMVVSSACHSGARVGDARAVCIKDLAAAGRLPPIVQQLDSLHTGLASYFDGNDEATKRTADAPAGFPKADELRELARRAMADGADGDKARADLAALRQRAAAESKNLNDNYWTFPAADRDKKWKNKLYLDAVVQVCDGADQTRKAAAALRALPPPQPPELAAIVNDPLLRANNPKAMSNDRRFMTATLGELADRIVTLLNANMPKLDFGTVAAADPGLPQKKAA